MSSKLSSLIVDIETNTASLKSGLEVANQHLEKFGHHAEHVGHLLEHVFEFEAIKEAGEKLYEFVKGGAEVSVQMGKTAQAVGLPIEAMSKLSYAAALSEVSTEQLGTGMKKLEKNMAEAAAGGNEQAAVFKAMGVSVKDAEGHLKPVDVMMGELANKFSGLEDGTAKSALAMEIFGKTGNEMIPFLNQGAEGIAKLGAEAEATGNIITDQAFESAENFSKSLIRMNKASTGVAIQLAAELTPALTAIAEQLQAGAKEVGVLHYAVKGLALAFKLVVEFASDVADGVHIVALSVIALAKAQWQALHGNFEEAGRTLEVLGLHVKWIAQDGAEFSKKLWADTNPIGEMMDREEKSAKKSADGILNTMHKLKKGTAKEDAAAEARRKKAFEASKYFMENTDINELVLKKPMHHFGARMTDAGGISSAEHGNTGRLSMGGSDSYIALLTAQDRLANAGNQAAKALTEEFLPKMGKLGDLIGAAQGPVANGAGDMLASAGVGANAGPLGAIIGIVVSMLGDSEGFIGTIEIVGEVVKTLANGLGAILTPVQLLVSSLMPLAVGLAAMFVPIGAVVNTVVQMLIPSLTMLGLMFQALSPMVSIAAGIMLTTTAPAFQMLVPALGVLFEGLKFLTLGVLYITKGVGWLWNKVEAAIANVLRDLSNISIKLPGLAAIKPFAALGDIANGLDATAVNIGALDNQIEATKQMTWAQTQAMAETTKAQILQKEAVDNATASMLNVPSGFKAALNRFNVSDKAVTSHHSIPGFAAGGVVSRATLALVGEGGREVITPEAMLRQVIREEGGGGNVTIVIQGGRDSKEELAKEVQRVLRRDNMRRGRPMLGGPIGGTT